MTINYGLFINAVINFLIVAFVLFMLLRQLNKLVAPGPPPKPRRRVRRCPAFARDPRQPEGKG